MKVCANEVFGPVLSILKARDLCEAIEISNDSDMGLQAGVFTNDLNKALYAAKHLEVGGVMINEVPDLPRRPHAVRWHQGLRHRPRRIEVRHSGDDRAEDGRHPRDGLADGPLASRRSPSRADGAVIGAQLPLG